MTTTRLDLLAYAVIGAAATPIAIAGGEPLAALCCVLAVLAFHLWRARRTCR
jgi:hypothetical protein